MTPINDQKLKDYFLGTLVREDSERLEEECAADAKLTEQANVVEWELADDYLRGSLSAHERRLFEENYLTTRTRREKLRTAENLWKAVAENQSASAINAPTWREKITAGYRLLAFGGLAAAIILAAVGLIFLSSHQQTETARNEVALPSPEQTTAATIEDGETRGHADLAPQKQKVKNSENERGKSEIIAPPTAPKIVSAVKPAPKPPTSAPTLATFTILPGTLRSDGEQFIRISPNVSRLNLKFTLPKETGKYENYRVTLKNADGEVLSDAPNLPSPTINLSAGKLASRTYMVLVEGRKADKSAEEIAEYTFRVRR